MSEKLSVSPEDWVYHCFRLSHFPRKIHLSTLYEMIDFLFIRIKWFVCQYLLWMNCSKEIFFYGIVVSSNDYFFNGANFWYCVSRCLVSYGESWSMRYRVQDVHVFFDQWKKTYLDTISDFDKSFDESIPFERFV